MLALAGTTLARRTQRAKESANSAPSGYDDETVKELTTWEIISIQSED